MEVLTITHWSLLGLGSLIMGMSKGGLPGAGNLTVAIYALVLEDALGPIGVPLSVGLLLPVLISADLTATLVYRKHTDWNFIIRLLPCFIIGTIIGWWVFDYFQGGDDRVRQLKYVIGGILLSMTALHFFVKIRKGMTRNKQKEQGEIPKGSILLGLIFGLLGGVATMLANAAGPIAQLYLLAMALPKYAFIGTSAWLFLIVNVIKIPFMIDLEIITLDSMSVSWWMFIPAMIGAAIAPLIVQYINQTLFERMVWFFIVLAGIRMIL
ncbi:sulfite exporter TauE/SafE family protein [Opitutales bacterium]|uniref:sulfite exporter TauE/SafE family protein n=1 Tax=Candidatus Seribacter sulfatis TaxID=3381756 RepID=UPI00231E9050|nr:sulfite exporter TauE/SafE family protein [Opitutales bacterium]